jgi:hypothetical protein
MRDLKLAPILDMSDVILMINLFMDGVSTSEFL